MSAVRRKPPHRSGTDSSATGPPPGRKTRDEPAGQVGGMKPAKRSTNPSEMGSTLLRTASASQSVAQLAHPLGLVVGLVDGLGEVGGQVEELPAVLGEVAAAGRQLLLIEHAGADVVGRGLPALVVDGPRAHHLEVLRVVHLGGAGVVERRQQAGPVHLLLGHAVDDVGQFQPGRLHDRGQEVDGVAELGADGSRLGHPSGPMEDEGGAGAPEPGVALPELVGGVAGPGPAPRVVVVGGEPSPVVVVRQVLLERLAHVRREAVLVDAAVLAHPRRSPRCRRRRGSWCCP